MAHKHSGRDTCATTRRPPVAIVGGESLTGKEVRELLEASGLAVSVKLVAAVDDEEAIIARQSDEAIVINSLAMADIGTAKVVFLAGSAESSRKAYEQIHSLDPRPAVIDLTGALEDNPAARLRAPSAEAADYRPEGEAIQVIAHPAAIALAIFLTQLRKAAKIQRSVVEIFEPASERGKPGLDEMQRQTVALLSFKPVPKEVFDAQVTFNMLPRYGSESPYSLETIEHKIDRHLASLLASTGGVPMPSLRLIQAPVFHGHSLSVWAEFEENPGPDALAKALEAANIDVRTKDHEPPSNVGVAGQSGITAGAIAPDRNNPRAAWFWVAADNLRIAAENAVEVARAYLK